MVEALTFHRLRVVVLVQLVLVRAHPYGVHHVGHLVGDPAADECLGEHAALRQELVVAPERLERIRQRVLV